MLRVSRLVLMALLAILVGCGKSSPQGIPCDIVEKNFSAGAYGSCQRFDQSLVFEITPENTPINPSPWYAFKMHVEASQTFSITLNYLGAHHRYAPKLLSAGKSWQQLPAERITVSDDGTSVSFELDLDAGEHIIAAQPIIAEADYQAWTALLQESFDIEVTSIGQSVEGRSIEFIESTQEGAQYVLLLLGRQHPPELTGAVAMMSFVEEVLGDSAIAEEFRSYVDIWTIPLLNPDGVEAGYWRHNMNGVDLNRDWGPFLQPETQAVQQLLSTQLAGRELLTMLDFHSTRKDVFYTQQDGEGSAPDFTHDWLVAIEGSESPIKFDRSSSHNPDLPTAKTYFHSSYGIPSITYELGDNSDPQQIREAAKISAQKFMELWLLRLR